MFDMCCVGNDFTNQFNQQSPESGNRGIGHAALPANGRGTWREPGARFSCSTATDSVVHAQGADALPAEYLFNW